MKIFKPLFNIYFALFLALFLTDTTAAQPKAQKANAAGIAEYQCLPCGQDCDNTIYYKPGKCPICHMQLVKRSTIHFKTIKPEEICAYVNAHPGAILLDVRTKEEFEGKASPDFGTLKNAINIPVQELERRLPGIGSLKQKEIIVYCSHGHRSAQASYLLTQNGFKNVTNMTGGMSVMKDGACKK